MTHNRDSLKLLLTGILILIVSGICLCMFIAMLNGNKTVLLLFLTYYSTLWFPFIFVIITLIGLFCLFAGGFIIVLATISIITGMDKYSEDKYYEISEGYTSSNQEEK